MPSTGKIVAGSLTSVTLLAAALTTVFEGDVRHAYPDVNGEITICYGDTQDVKKGEVDTQAECTARLQTQLAAAETYIRPCIKVTTGPHTMAAMVDFAYNAGSGAFCRSSMAVDLNAGRHTQACSDLLKYVYSQGKVYAGLQRRRVAEQKLCLQDPT